MTARRFVLALDQGTTRTTALVVDAEGEVRGRGYAELPQHFPRPGWVEHNPEEIWKTTEHAAQQALAAARVGAGVLVGGLFSFMTSLQEASATLFLSLGGWEMMTVGIFNFYIAGSANEAAALGFILIVVAAASLIVINKVAGTRMGGMFG